MEYEKEDLRQISCHQNTKNYCDGGAKAPVLSADAVVKCQARNAADDQCCRVDDVGCEVKMLNPMKVRFRHDILNVGEVPSSAKKNKLEADANKRCKKKLPEKSVLAKQIRLAPTITAILTSDTTARASS